MKKAILMVLLILIPLVCFAEQEQQVGEYYKDGEHYVEPNDGFVPDTATAIKIAEAVWLPIYGEDVHAEQPFNAVLKDDIWTVTGSLPEGWVGGVAVAEISKKDGKILRVSHGK